MAKCTANDAANYLVYLMDGIYDDVSNMKINKMLYYAQGHYLQETGCPLFDDKLEAWGHGPVVESVYRKYKKYGDGAIKEYDLENAKKMPKDISNFLRGIAREYGKYTAIALRNKTHMPNSPWDQVYVDEKRHIEIPLDSIKNYFDSYEKRIEDIKIPIGNESFVGYRDKDDNLVLPRDWDE